MRSLLTILFITISLQCSFGQSQTKEEVDKNTYDTFMAKDYKKTIEMGTNAINNNIDFYFLRYRLGVSYYELKNYVAATEQLEKAKDMDDSDPILLEYLYYAYLFSANNTKAELLAEKFPTELKQKVNYKPTLFRSVAIEGGYLSNPKFNINMNLRGNNQFARGVFYSDASYANITITNSFSPKFKLVNSLNYVSNTSNEIIQGLRNDVFTNNNTYIQWNAVGMYNTGKWGISGGFGLYNSTYYVNTPPRPFQPFSQNSTQTVTTTNFSGSMSLSRRFKYIESGIAISYNNLSSVGSFSTDVFATYYPFGNHNFYGNSKIGFVSNSSASNSIFTQLIGLKIFNKTWLEGFGAVGNHQNYISDNGLSAFNTPDKINWYMGANLNFFFKKFDLSFGYNYQERGSSYTTNINPTQASTVDYKYNYNLFKTKIVWKF